MKQKSSTLRQQSLPDRTEVAERLVAFLRAKHPQKTAENVAALTGLDARSVQKLMERHSVPCGTAMLEMIRVYGAEFLTFVMADASPEWAVRADRAARQAMLEAQLAATQSELASLLG